MPRNESNLAIDTRKRAASMLRDIRSGHSTQQSELLGWIANTCAHSQPIQRFVARCELAALDLDDAAVRIARGLARQPGHGGWTTLRAELMMKKGDLQRARTEARFAMRARPRHSATLRLAAQIEIELGAHREAIAILRHACSIKPDDATLFTELAVAQLEAGVPEEAERTIDRHPDAPAALIAKLRTAQGRFVDAERLLADAISIASPDEKDALIAQRINTLMRFAPHDTLRTAIDTIESDQPHSCIAAGRALLVMGEFTRCLKTLITIVRQPSPPAEALAICVVAASHSNRETLASRLLTRLHTIGILKPTAFAELWRLALAGSILAGEARAPSADPNRRLLPTLLASASTTLKRHNGPSEVASACDRLLQSLPK